MKRVPWASTFATNILIFGSGLVGGVISSRFLGPEGRGELEGLTYWTHFSVGFFTLGLNESIAILVAKGGMRRDIAGTAVWLSLGLAAALAIVLAIALPFLIGHDRTDHLDMALVYAAIFLPATFLAQNLLAIVQGRLDFAQFNLQRIYQSIAYPICLGTFLMLDMLNVTTAAISMLAGTTIVALARMWVLRREVVARPSIVEARSMVRTGFKIHLANMAMFLATQLDYMLIILIGTSHDLGIYTGAMVFGRAAIGLFVQTFTNVSLPFVARLTSLSDSESNVSQHVTVMVILLILTCAGGWLVLPFVVPLLLGSAFEPSIFVAQLLMVGCAFGGARKTLIYILRSRFINRDAIIAESVTGVLVLVCGFFAFRASGNVGMAWAVVVANAIGAAYMGWAFRRLVAVPEADQPLAAGK